MINENGTIDCRIDRAIVVAWYYLSESITPSKLDFLASNFLSAVTIKRDGKQIFSYCDDIEKEYIGKIILKIIEKNNLLLEKLNNGEIKPSVYLTPLSKNFRWGENLIILAKEFGVEIKTEQLTLS